MELATVKYSRRKVDLFSFQDIQRGLNREEEGKRVVVFVEFWVDIDSTFTVSMKINLIKLTLYFSHLRVAAR